MTTNRPIPDQTAPALEFPVLGVPESRWDLAKAEPDKLSLLIFYRGLHCPVCKSYLQEFDKRFADFADRGVELCALSMDSKERAEKAKQDWGIENVPIGYDLDEATARRWGLYLSRSISEKEPRLFSEPGLFMVKRGGKLLYAAINSMPFGRPQPSDLLDAIDFIQKNDYPARGRVAA